MIRTLILALFLSFGAATAPIVSAQVISPDNLPDIAPDPNDPRGDDAPENDGEDDPLDFEAMEEARPDIFFFTPEQREEQLSALFDRLAAEENSDNAELIAEEIWAIWLQSGSASVDLLLRRAVAAQNRGDSATARRFYEHVLRLQPDYAEGWARSGRLALAEGRYGDAIADTTQALILEPRHFYAMWTLGNIYERTGNQEAAFAIYSDALEIYPALEPLKNRADALRSAAQGDAL